MRKALLTAAGAGVALALLTGCSSGDTAPQVPSISSPNASPKANSGPGAAVGKTDSAADRDAMRKFAKCMREHGIDTPDPGENEAPTISFTDDPKNQAALDACKKLLPGGGVPKKLTPEELDKARKDAKCMREHGIDMPDPSADGGARAMPMEGDGTKMEEAMKACGMGMAGK
ncbi:hypothetical protein [Amycolatopsis silviterrae]|uniref:Secreted protein n=1 Tax=Amycolatopsis silviterrae TaxID=1656914 RepID=A0ABW5HCM5_9PSEU